MPISSWLNARNNTVRRYLEADKAKHYYNTNGTFIQVTDLGQVIALAMQNLSWAAKPADIFVNKDNHDKIFGRSLPRFTRDIVFVSNLYKAMKRGLNTYLELPVHANSNAPVIFKKPILRAHVFYLAQLHFYQNDRRQSARADTRRAPSCWAAPHGAGGTTNPANSATAFLGPVAGCMGGRPDGWDQQGRPEGRQRVTSGPRPRTYRAD